MNARLLLVLASIALAAAASLPHAASAAAVRAYTEDGRAVLLSDDGTWVFAAPQPEAGSDDNPPLPTPNRGAAPPPDAAPGPGQDSPVLSGDPRSFERDGSQDAVVNGVRAPYQFWYDQTRWFLKEENDEPLSEYEFVDASTLVQAMTVAYPFDGGVEDLQAKVFAAIQATDPEALVIFQEDRVVNSKLVRCVHVKALVADESFVFYFYLNVSGGMAVQAACFTAENVFHALYDELTQFMNGFVAP